MAYGKTSLNTPMEILHAALRKEKNAYVFYDELLKRSTVDFVTELLEELRDAESQHIKMIQHKITALQQKE